jgi:hypothetical protein
MPFTFSHPAIILPFARLKSSLISMSCLVVGSMTPDFQYFLQMKLSGRIGHTWHGAFIVDLPLAVLLVFIFHLIVKRPLIDNLPVYFKSRLLALRDFDFFNGFKENTIGYLVCLQIGILSHIFWDSFTHANAYFVEHMEFLSWNIDYEGMPNRPLFRYVQHISTLIGGLILGLFFHHMPKQETRGNISTGYWVLSAVFMIIPFVIRSFYGYRFFGDFVVACVSSFFLGFIIAGTLNHSFFQRIILRL